MTSFIDRQGRLFGKVGLVDILILLILAALVVFAFVRFAKPTEAQVTVQTTLAVEKVRDPTIVTIAKGAPVYDEGGALLGYVYEEPKATRMPLDVFTADGRPVEGAVSQVYWDLEIKIRGEGHDSGSDITVGGVVLRVGMPLMIHGPGFGVKTQIQGVTVVED